MQPEARRGIYALGHLLDHHRAEQEVHARAAILFRYVGQQQPRLAGPAPHLAADLAFLLPALVIGRNLSLDEGGDGPAKELMLLAVDLARYGHGTSPQYQAQQLVETRYQIASARWYDSSPRMRGGAIRVLIRPRRN